MGGCKRIQPKSDKVCIGKLDSLISIQLRSKVPPATNEVVGTISLSDKKDVWAMHVSTNGEVVFDSSNLEAVVTDKFYIRYDSTIVLSVMDSIIQEDIRYKIIDIEDLNGNKEFLLITTSRRGDASLSRNLL